MGPLHILLVDDSVLVGECLSQFLEHRINCACTHVTSGASAIDQLASSHVDILVTDFERPDEDISIFLRDVRRAHPTLPILILSGWIPTPDAPPPSDPIQIGKIRAINATGADLVAPKTLSLSELTAHIGSLMPKARKHAQAARLSDS